MDLFFGRRPVIEALMARKSLKRVLVAQEAHGIIINDIITKANQQGITVERVPHHQIEALFPMQNHQGVIAETDINNYKNYSLDELLDIINKQTTTPFLLILDGIQDPRNLGALVRTANAAGVQGVIIPRHRAAGITPAVIKTSAGATEHIPIVRVANLIQTCIVLKKSGFWIIGTDASAKGLWFQVDFTCPVAIVLGAEGKGMHRLLREECDIAVRLPMAGSIGSLNVSVAGGILMYEVLRQRMSRSGPPFE